MLTQGYVPLFASEQTAAYLAIYSSVVKITPPDYRNYRYPLEKGFLGYLQLFQGQAVSGTVTLEYQSQLVYQNYDCCQLVFARLCQLADYLKAATTDVKTGISLSAGGLGISVSPSFNLGFDPFPDLLPTTNPTAIAFELEPNAVGELTIVSLPYSAISCFPDVAVPDNPDSCGGSGTPAPQMPRGCIPVPPGGGGS